MSTSLEALPPEVGLLRARFHRVRRMGVTFVEGPQPPAREESRRPSHVARMVALAHHLEAAINRGQLRNAATVAFQLGLTRARLTYLLDLRLLAPDIQEELLFLEAVDGEEPVGERVLRAVVHAGTWEAQRQRWRELKASF